MSCGVRRTWYVPEEREEGDNGEERTGTNNTPLVLSHQCIERRLVLWVHILRKVIELVVVDHFNIDREHACVTQSGSIELTVCDEPEEAGTGTRREEGEEGEEEDSEPHRNAAAEVARHCGLVGLLEARSTFRALCGRAGESKKGEKGRHRG